MGVKGRLTGEIEVNSHGHRVHEHYIAKPHNFSNVCPTLVQGFELHNGEHGKPGSIYFWNYTIGGKACVMKALIESVDDVNKVISFEIVEGDPLNDYKKFVFHVHTTAKEAKWIIEYEKLHKDGPHPTDYLNLALTIGEGVDNHHLKL